MISSFEVKVYLKKVILKIQQNFISIDYLILSIGSFEGKLDFCNHKISKILIG